MMADEKMSNDAIARKNGTESKRSYYSSNLRKPLGIVAVFLLFLLIIGEIKKETREKSGDNEDAVVTSVNEPQEPCPPKRWNLGGRVEDVQSVLATDDNWKRVHGRRGYGTRPPIGSVSRPEDILVRFSDGDEMTLLEWHTGCGGLMEWFEVRTKKGTSPQQIQFEFFLANRV